MSILEELNTVIKTVGVPVETGVFTGKVPDSYIVLTPMTDLFSLHADNRPNIDIQEVRISLFTKKNYLPIKRALQKKLLQADFVLTERKYLGLDTETGYHGYSIDVEKYYELEDS